jgi:hypothetical protein
MAQKSSLYYASVNGGHPSQEQEVTNSVCYCCKTALAAGPEGKLHAAWRHVYPGNLRDIAFATSPAVGRPFSAPTRISEDGWVINGCPDDGPAIVVDAAGTVHAVWPTVVGGAKPEGALFYASSRDGQEFSPRVRVPALGGPKPTHPQIAIDARGRIAIAWDEGVNGRRIAAVRELKLGPDGAPSFGEIVTLSSSGPGMYPVVAATDKAWVAAWTTMLDPSRVEVRRFQLP